ncbi:hypothetical protein N9B94_00805 [Verrucomicrobia bacterium]|nr:hypothetical protein [Verrucomicrobiota bacterium]
MSEPLTSRDVEESFEDPFAIRLLPDSGKLSAQSRYFNLGQASAGSGIFSIFRTNGKIFRVIHSRAFTPEEQFFYFKKRDKMLTG